MRWIAILALMLALVGCTPVETAPPKYASGDIVYHKVDGRKMVVTSHAYSDIWYARYSDEMGELHEQSFRESELTDSPVGLDE